MTGMNIFRILGDVSHTVSKCILIWAIHSNKSAEGVSLITQALYAVVFCTRYLDIFGPIFSMWNFVLKIFYIVSSLYILFLMMRVYARTREREMAWKLGSACFGGSAIVAPLLMMLFEGKFMWGFQEILWVFSIILESTCILPQLLLLRQTTVPTVLTSFYLLTLGSYRGFYILNWIWRELDTNDRKPDAISIIFGIVQTALYVDFALVYWGRQRVKLRNGGVVDQDDFAKSWLLTRVLSRFGSRNSRDDNDSIDGEQAERGLVNGSNGRSHGSSKNSWGRRGISVTADDPHFNDHGEDDVGSGDDNFSAVQSNGRSIAGAQQSGTVVRDNGEVIRNPDEMERVLDEAGEEEDEILAGSSVQNDATEWRD